MMKERQSSRRETSTAMPFDGIDFEPKREKRERAGPSDNLVTVLIVLLAICMLVTPISIAGLVDTVRYLHGN